MFKENWKFITISAVIFIVAVLMFVSSCNNTQNTIEEKNQNQFNYEECHDQNIALQGEIVELRKSNEVLSNKKRIYEQKIKDLETKVKRDEMQDWMHRIAVNAEEFYKICGIARSYSNLLEIIVAAKEIASDQYGFSLKDFLPIGKMESDMDKKSRIVREDFVLKCSCHKNQKVTFVEEGVYQILWKQNGHPHGHDADTFKRILGYSKDTPLNDVRFQTEATCYLLRLDIIKKGTWSKAIAGRNPDNKNYKKKYYESKNIVENWSR